MILRLGTISIGVVLLSACTSATAPTTTTGEPGAATTTSTTTMPVAATTAAPDSEYSREIGGRLPDGTPYVVRFDTPVDPTVQGISAAIILDDDSELSRVIGISFFFLEGEVEPGLDARNRYTERSGGGGVTISIYDEVADRFAHLEAFLADHIHPGLESRLPNFELSSPLRWATDVEIPLQMEVVYEGFVVRRGCGDLAVACNETGAVQVIPENLVFSSENGLPAEQVWIESTAPRPADSPSYLDPGPLGVRGRHDVLWTGEEMIVWGGANGDRLPNLIDGAAFDPDTATWRMLAPAPLENSTVTRAIWAEDMMIVVSREATLAYDPKVDVWSVIAGGIYPPDYPGLTAGMGDGVAAWTSSGIQLLDLDSGAWTQLPSPGFGTGDRWDSTLRVVDGTLYAIGSVGYCGGREAASWSGTDWAYLPVVELDGGEYADCSYPNQTGVAGGTLVAWGDDIHESMAYDPDANVWSPIETFPLAGSEGPSGPVQLDDGFLVPRWGEGAIFDPATGTWAHVVLAGSGEDTEMVWTGEELLMWGWECCYGDGRDEFVSMDAWRWTPPG